MSAAYVPQQPQPTRVGPPPAPPQNPPHASEATRLLCAGVYLDSAYRDRVIDELHLNEQRIVAPSLGFDAARVLAHALRARRQELAWAGAIIGLWLVGSALSGGLLLGFLGPSLTLAIASWVRGRAAEPPLYRRVPAFFLRWWGRLTFAGYLVITVWAAFAGIDDGSSYGSSYGSYDPYGPGSSGAPSVSDLVLPGNAVKPWQAWFALGVLALIALCIAQQRRQFARVMAAELSTQRFPDAAGDPAEQEQGARFERVRQRIRLEQHAPLIMYHEARPFCGAGSAFDTWVLAVELVPDSLKKQQPLSNRAVLEKVRPLLAQLRVPAEYAGPGVRDRLRWLEMDECVFLPAEGLLRREDAPYHPQAFEEHRARAVEEGGEKRRHFLRIRVGGWEEELVVTVFVRVHTQGRMLMLEIAPHVLTPVREDFKDADRTAHRFRHNNVLGRAAWALARVPGSPARALITFGRAVVYGWRLLTGGYAGALPDGPALSVRELGSTGDRSLFQDMDVDRYLKSVQDRVAHGVRAALAESGYRTGEFVQRIVNISNGGVHIGHVEGSTFAVGEHASASATTGGPAPQKGSDTDGHG
ncbi:hypothetical protein [Streptomyces chiangmaiensis]|uniref:Uncharacterized protein n=1 Tax=Streptomyces chiangmaiensis TaxID=766497 RepID=A0ABU7FD65_9ACTN|nr:hypothetical protein [Streptomyces chiangmaiensis]MED7822111.1 hypothetical protein [Streptomyces chiangmaiensis]